MILVLMVYNIILTFCYIHIFLQTNDSTTLHLAAAGGHKEVVKTLLEAGACATDENAVSYNAVHYTKKPLLVVSKRCFKI